MERACDVEIEQCHAGRLVDGRASDVEGAPYGHEVADGEHARLGEDALLHRLDRLTDLMTRKLRVEHQMPGQAKHAVGKLAHVPLVGADRDEVPALEQGSF